MPRINFQNVEDAEDYSPLPDGVYLCRLANIADNNQTKAGDEMWDLKFVVERGEYRGRHIFDRISFGLKALSRVKLLCSRLGIDVTQSVDVTPGLLLARKVYVTVETETYIDRDGTEKPRNNVPFAGYAPHENGSGAASPVAPAGGADDDDDDLPF